MQLGPFHDAVERWSAFAFLLQCRSSGREPGSLPPPPFPSHLLQGARVYRLRRDSAESGGESGHCAAFWARPRHCARILALLQSCMFAYVKNI